MSRNVDRIMQNGDSFERDDDGYEAARRGAVWNAFTPPRFPDRIVIAASEADVVRAVRDARDGGMRIGVRSGGHSWAGNHVRDGGLLLDLSRLDAIELDADAMTASVGPGCRGDVLVAALAEQGCFFPAGHCPGVGLGGYLLQGGYGWNGRVHGPACMSVEAIDVVTAAGELVRADARQNSELLWAARGAGPGFFGVVTRFHLRLQPRPAVVANAVYTYPLDALEEVFTWAHALGPRVPRAMELMLVLHHDEHGEPEIAVTGPVLVVDEDEARAAVALLEHCPARERAKLAVPYVRGELPDLYAGVHAAYPDGHRYATDNMWTHAPVEQLLPGLRRIAETMPPAPSHMLWMNWGPGATPAPARPEMAYSMEDDTYVACYAVWQDPEQDGTCVAWATERMRELEAHASGIQLADENLGRRPARFASDANMARLDALRARWDPDGLFHPWMGRL
jgi:FAD/FMN-containing dehydrogenase